jgi:hypothetical protein
LFGNFFFERKGKLLSPVATGEAAVDHELGDPVRVGRGEHDGDRTAFRGSVEDRRFDFGCVHDGSNVVHSLGETAEAE